MCHFYYNIYFSRKIYVFETYFRKKSQSAGKKREKVDSTGDSNLSLIFIAPSEVYLYLYLLFSQLNSNSQLTIIFTLPATSNSIQQSSQLIT